MAASKMAGAGGCDLQQGRSFRGAVLPIKSAVAVERQTVVYS